MNDSLKKNACFPVFFDRAQLVKQNQLGEKYNAAFMYAKSIFLKAGAICDYEKYFLSPQIVERFFINDKKVLGYQCVFFDKNTELSSLERETLQGLTFKELVDSLDRQVLVKIGLVWEKGPDKAPTLTLCSNTMEIKDLDFMKFMLKPFDFYM